MNIFNKRPLCLILCIGLCGFLLYSFENRALRIALIVSAFLLGFLSLILRIRKHKRVLLLLSACAIIASSILAFLYFDLYFKAYKIYDDPVDVVGEVEAVSASSSYTLRLQVKAESVNGERVRGYRFYTYVNKSDADGIIEGAIVSFTASLDGFSDESFTYNISNGINAYASDVENLTLIEYSSIGISSFFGRIREYITRYMMKLSSADAGAIISALLLGERDYLPDQLRLDFKRIGVSHILALSGMHLAILSLGIGKALTLAGVKKKARVAIISAFVILYMALTGFSVSVVRAGLMLLIASVLFLLSRSKDSLTSLSVAVLIICIVTPYAILDISLWLSALATFGIIAFSEFSADLTVPKSRKYRIIRYFLLAILASVFAISATMAVSSASFGGFSILAPISTIIFSFLAEIIMYLGCIMLLIGRLIPIGLLLRPICSFMSWLAGVFSEIKIAYVSSNFIYVTIIILIYTAVFYSVLIFPLKRSKRAVNLVVVLFIFAIVVPTIATAVKSHTETVAYISDTKSDQMLIRSKNQVCLINSSQYEKSLAYTTIELLEDTNVTYVDKYYLTHYSWSIDDEIETLIYNIAVKEIYIPEPRNEDEETILKILYKTVENHRTDVVVFGENERVYVGDYSIELLYSTPYGTTSMNAFCVSKGDEMFTYISSGLLDNKVMSDLSEYILGADHLILGDHGKKYKEKMYLDDRYEDLDSLILHSENVFLERDNMQYLLDRGCIIFSHPKEVVYLCK